MGVDAYPADQGTAAPQPRGQYQSLPRPFNGFRKVYVDSVVGDLKGGWNKLITDRWSTDRYHNTFLISPDAKRPNGLLATTWVYKAMDQDGKPIFLIRDGLAKYSPYSGKPPPSPSDAAIKSASSKEDYDFFGKVYVNQDITTYGSSH